MGKGLRLPAHQRLVVVALHWTLNDDPAAGLEVGLDLQRAGAFARPSGTFSLCPTKGKETVKV